MSDFAQDRDVLGNGTGRSGTHKAESRLSLNLFRRQTRLKRPGLPILVSVEEFISYREINNEPKIEIVDARWEHTGGDHRSFPCWLPCHGCGVLIPIPLTGAREWPEMVI
jgi:hypothetical protein